MVPPHLVGREGGHYQIRLLKENVSITSTYLPTFECGDAQPSSVTALDASIVNGRSFAYAHLSTDEGTVCGDLEEAEEANAHFRSC